LFPFIRICKDIFRRQLLALYEDALLVGWLRKGIPLEEEHCLPEGRLGIRTLLNSRQEIPWSQVRCASAAEPTSIPGVGPNWRFQVDAGTCWADFQVRPEDIGNVLRVFEALLPGRFTRLRGARHQLSPRRVRFFLLLFGIPAIVGALLGALAAGLLGALFGAFSCVAYVAFMALLLSLEPVLKRRRERAERKRLEARKKKKMRDLSGKQPIRSRSLGWVLKIGALAFLVCLISGYIRLPEGTVGVVLGWLLWLPAAAVMYLGYRLSLVDPRQADDRAAQRPILYLRAFDDDHKTNLQPPSQWNIVRGVAPHTSGRRPWLARLVNEWWTGLIRKFFNKGVDTAEEQLAHYFSKFGPFVAIGRPGEPLPSPGAERIYVRDEEWQQAVLERLDRCQAVVLQPGRSSGIWWEVQQTLARVEPFRILVCLVNFRDRPEDWEEFRLRVEPLLGGMPTLRPVPLPRSVPFLDEFSFLYFERDWTVRVQRLNYRQPVCWPILGDATDLDYTLGPFVQGMHGGDREPPRPPKQRPCQLAMLTTFMLLLQAVLVNVALFLGKSQESFGKKIDFGSGQEVYFTKGATEADARAFGAFLRNSGYFNGRGPKAVRVSRDGNPIVVSFIVQQWVLNDLQTQLGFYTLGQQAAEQAFGGEPVDVHLCDEYFRVKKRMESFGRKIDFGGGQAVYYTKGASEADARLLGDFLGRVPFLDKVAFFNGKDPAAVRLSRDGSRLVISFIVTERVLDDPRLQQEFHILGQQAAEQAFAGEPVEVQLCDEYFRVKKKM
jgi:hypothetical protein